MKVNDFVKGELVEITITAGENLGKQAIGYIYNKQYSLTEDKLMVVIINSEFPTKLNKVLPLLPIGSDYKITTLRETSQDALYDMMDFALDIKDFELAQEIYDRLFPSKEEVEVL